MCTGNHGMGRTKMECPTSPHWAWPPCSTIASPRPFLAIYLNFLVLLFIPLPQRKAHIHSTCPLPSFLPSPIAFHTNTMPGLLPFCKDHWAGSSPILACFPSSELSDRRHINKSDLWQPLGEELMDHIFLLKVGK